MSLQVLLDRVSVDRSATYTCTDPGPGRPVGNNSADRPEWGTARIRFGESNRWPSRRRRTSGGLSRYYLMVTFLMLTGSFGAPSGLLSVVPVSAILVTTSSPEVILPQGV